MKYYPKSQIKTGLYTKGNEFIVIQTGEQYKGYYWGTSAGEFYTGENPNTRPSNRLSPVSSIDQNTLKVQQESLQYQSVDEQNSYYIPDIAYNNAKNISNDKKAPLPPKQTVSLPSQEDYTNDYFMRYFLKKNNEYKYIEISRADYQLYNIKSSNIQYELYTPVSIKWSLISDNSYNVAYIENTMGWYGFIKYFKGKF